MAKKAKKITKTKKARKTKSAKLPKLPAKASLARGSGARCRCAEAEDGLFYCFKQVQGRWISCRGPYDSLQECLDTTNERCA